ncbi:hypothetical protein ACQKPX_12650 [Photobacterium sp. DNB23_23_1]|uniref:Glycine zipper domain-containing protein n=1 Tax=Photobacterium pectinilyticum TaxID=2906793 RepID=A0ABT1N373_9GAMM|nr:hypothetical protein [Photobacterium sp. ZSDE20]MCQ1059164.1 hypothetical protein [Photobacterium sp. ZSDE20]MDD1824816.1 hypothetical protein [Photobacterium sp. ZSDE20]
MNTFAKSSIVSIIGLTLLTGCVNPDNQDDPNALTKQGAAGGALLGLTLGALTGEADLAVKGAIAGGVTGGVAGASADIQNNRDNQRHDSRNDALAQMGNGGQATTTNTQPQNWDKLDNFTGDWNVNIWSGATEQPVNATANASGSLVKTTEASININNVTVGDQAQALSFNANFAYTPEAGYSLTVTDNANNVPVTFAGEFQQNMNRYNFYPTNAQASIYENFDSSTVRLELGFAGQNVWMVDTYALVDGEEQKIQTYRFTKS